MGRKICDYIAQGIFFTCVLITIAIWLAIIVVEIYDCYEQNHNSLWITIPIVIILHLWIFLTHGK